MVKTLKSRTTKIMLDTFTSHLTCSGVKILIPAKKYKGSTSHLYFKIEVRSLGNQISDSVFHTSSFIHALWFRRVLDTRVNLESLFDEWCHCYYIQHSIRAWWLRVILNKNWTQKLFRPTLINQTATAGILEKSALKE